MWLPESSRTLSKRAQSSLLGWWMVSAMACPARAIALSRCITPKAEAESRPDVGSSRRRMAGRLTSSTASERRRLWDVSEVSWTCPGHDQLHQRATAPLPPAQSLAEDVADDGVAARLEADEPQRLLLECARLLGAGAVACAMGVVVSSG